VTIEPTPAKDMGMPSAVITGIEGDEDI